MNSDDVQPIKLELQDIRKSFTSQDKKPETLEVFKGISFSVKRGEFACILGPSGCGKTTLLKIIDGLIVPDSGKVLIDGMPVKEPGYDRAFIFQEINLLPWRTALDNVIIGLEFQGLEKEEAKEKAMPYLEMVRLQDFRNYYPHQLSGGMKQRVGIARALVIESQIFLSDEPFGSLDALTREVLQVEFLRVLEQTRKTVVFVTHDIDEAIFLGDRILVLSPRPSAIKRELKIDIQRPRRLPDAKLTPRFSEYRKVLWEALVAEKNNATK